MAEETRYKAYSHVPEEVRAIFDAVRDEHHSVLDGAQIDVVFAAGRIKVRGEEVAAKVTLAPPVVTAQEDIHAWVLVNPKWFEGNDPRQTSIDQDQKARRLVMERVFDECLCGLSWDDEGEKLRKVPGVTIYKAIIARYGPLPGSMEAEVAEVVAKREEAGLGPWQALPGKWDRALEEPEQDPLMGHEEV